MACAKTLEGSVTRAWRRSRSAAPVSPRYASLEFSQRPQPICAMDIGGSRRRPAGSGQSGIEYRRDFIQQGRRQIFQLAALHHGYLKVFQPAHGGIQLQIHGGRISRIDLQQVLVGLEGSLIVGADRLRPRGGKQLVDGGFARTVCAQGADPHPARGSQQQTHQRRDSYRHDESLVAADLTARRFCLRRRRQNAMHSRAARNLPGTYCRAVRPLRIAIAPRGCPAIR